MWYVCSPSGLPLRSPFRYAFTLTLFLAISVSGCALKLNNPPSATDRGPSGVSTNEVVLFDSSVEGGAPTKTSSSFRIERSSLGGSLRKKKVTSASFALSGGLHAQ